MGLESLDLPALGFLELWKQLVDSRDPENTLLTVSNKASHPFHVKEIQSPF